MTIATQGLSFAIGQQRHFDWRVMVGSIASTLANVGIKQKAFSTPAFNDALANASGTVASIGVNKLFNGDMSTEDIAANTLGTIIGNQLAAQVKQHYADYQLNKRTEAQYRMSQIPEIIQTLEQLEHRFIQSVLAHPHGHGALLPSSSLKNNHVSSSTRSNPASHRNNRHGTVTKSPPHEHLIVERAREEAHMCRSSRWNEEHSRTPTQQRPSKTSRHGFWDMVERAGNSKIVSTINNIGDNVAHSLIYTVDDLLDPFKQIKTTYADANEAVYAFQNGEIRHGIVSTGKVALDELYFVPVVGFVAREVEYGVKGVSAFCSKLSFFGSKGASNTNNVQLRVTQMMEKNIAYNVSPEAWFQEFKTIGQYGTYVTDYRAIGEVIGPMRANTKINVGFFSKANQISLYKSRQLERSLGLRARTLDNGFRFTRVSNLNELHLRSPLGGNELFLEPGKGLPGGGPELIIDSIPTSPWPAGR